MTVILPSETQGPPAPSPPGRSWGPLQTRLHRQLRREPELLPAGAPLLLALSGGQDSMALLQLLRDLQPLHHWQLILWHGDHRWRPEASQQADGLAAWARQQGLAITVERAPGAPSSEAEARHWRYGCLRQRAQELGCRHVLTAHTANDRAETLLLHLARGADLGGLSSLRRQRLLQRGMAIQLVRPLLAFSRSETGQICSAAHLPLWVDGSNDDPRFSRNRIRQAVLPVLEQLHPGAAGRISALAERLEQQRAPLEELLPLALAGLRRAGPLDPEALDRRQLNRLSEAHQRQLLDLWLRQRGCKPLGAQGLQQLVERLGPQRGPGRCSLTGGQTLGWDRRVVELQPPRPLNPPPNP